MKDHLREKQIGDLEEVFPMETEEGMEEDFIPQAPSEWDQRDRQEEEWSLPVSVGERGGDVHVWESPRIPPTPAPSEDRFFTDWSSLGSGSPPVRIPPQSALVGENKARHKSTCFPDNSIWIRANLDRSHRKGPSGRYHCFYS